MDRDLELLYEVGALRYMPRQWQRFHMPGVANNAEHMFRVVWIALTLAKRVTEDVDTEKIVKMAIAHDIAESRTGDVDYLSRQYVDRHEAKALEDMFEDTSVGDDFVELLQEYETRTSLEAKIVKDADNLDVDMELREQSATGVKLAGEDSWTNMRKHVGETKLYTDAAREMHKAIWLSNPHDWHMKSKGNRMNSGDWKEK